MALSNYPGRKQGCVYHVDGYHGRKLDVFPNKCVFTIIAGRQSVGHGDFEAGEKTVWFKDACSLFYHRCDSLYGWFVLEPYNSSSSYQSSHTFLYSEKEISNRDMDDLIAYITYQMDLIKGFPLSTSCLDTASRKGEATNILNDSSHRAEIDAPIEKSSLESQKDAQNKEQLKEDYDGWTAWDGINPDGEKAVRLRPSPEREHFGRCPKCRSEQRLSRHKCWHCGIPFMFTD